MIEFRKTDRGFIIGEFKDRYGINCSIQESSLATEYAIWLGCNEGVHTNNECLARMHLTQEQVGHLLPVLQYFLDTGELPDK